jgi:hypothetical protein
MLTRMNDSPNSDPRASAAVDGPGVLASLPRTRPQMASARRTASRAAKPGKAPRQATKRRPAKRRPTPGEPAPRQGFEAEPDSLGESVQPPGGAELIASAAELAGELAKAGVTTGARALRDLLSRLPG